MRHLDAVEWRAGGRHPFPAAFRLPRPGLPHFVQTSLAQGQHGGADEILAQVQQQAAERRGRARIGRHQCGRRLQFIHQAAAEQRAGTAEEHQREVARVVPPLGRNAPQRAGDMLLGDADDRFRRRVEVEVEGGGDPGDGRLGPRALQVRPAVGAEHGRRAQAAEHELGVGHRRPGAALGIAGGARLGAGALRPDAQQAAPVDPGDRAAAGADRADIDHRPPDRQAEFQLALRPHRGLAAVDQADVAAGAADVAPERLGEAGLRGDPGRRRYARGRTGEHRVDRQPGRFRPVHRAAVRLGHQQLAAEARLAEPPGKRAQIACHHRLHIGVDRRRGGAFELAGFLRDVARHGQAVRRPAEGDQAIGQGPLRRAIAVAVEEADHQGVGLHFAKARDDGFEFRLLGRVQNPARGIERDVRLESAVARDQRREARLQAVSVRPVAAAQLQHVAKAPAGKQCRPAALAFDQRVDGDGGAVDGGLQTGDVDVRAFERRHETPRRVGRGARHLGDFHAPVGGIDGDEVGKRAADIDADLHAPTPLHRIRGRA